MYAGSDLSADLQCAQMAAVDLPMVQYLLHGLQMYVGIPWRGQTESLQRGPGQHEKGR